MTLSAGVRTLILLVLAGLAGCGGLPAQTSLPVYTSLPVVQNPSPSSGPRRPNIVVLHHTGSPDPGRALRALTEHRSQVSAHYLVARDGTLHYLVDELARSWHSGDSYWAGVTDLNSASIGIELDNDGVEPYSEAQLRTLLALLGDLKARYKIPAANFVGHGDVAPGRKTDPGANFPWKRLADAGFGLWCEPPYPQVASGVDTTTLLMALGYDVTNVEAAAAAFKRRFVPAGNEREVTEDDLGRLMCLVQRRLFGR